MKTLIAPGTKFRFTDVYTMETETIAGNGKETLLGRASRRREVEIVEHVCITITFGEENTTR